MNVNTMADQLRAAELSIAQRLLPYHDGLEERSLNDLDLVVIHCTELPSLEMAREYGEQIVHEESGTGNSGHFYIDLDGSLHQWVELQRVAHHVRGMNERSIGIELVNAGRYPDWFRSDQQLLADPYPAEQVVALKRLLKRLEKLIPGLSWIAGHEELDKGLVPSEDDPEILVRRKVDPGPLFPWPEVESACSLSRWREESVYG